MGVSMALIATLLAGCGGGGVGSFGPFGGGSAASAVSISNAIGQAESSGAIPILNRDATVTGVDANANGVRDDIDQYINSLPDTVPQKAALTQSATALGIALTVNTADPIALNAAATKVMNSTICLYSVYGTVQASQKGGDIEKFTVNTRTRLAAYEAFNTALSGSTAKIPTGGSGCGY